MLVPGLQGIPRRRLWPAPLRPGMAVLLGALGILVGERLSAAETLQPVPASVSEPVTMLEAVNVTAEREVASDIEGAELTESFAGHEISDSGAFSLEEFFETLPPGENGQETLVLIDGQPAYIDPASLPLDMIEGIELNRDGTMPAYGGYANGRVINIRLKKDYSGGELAGRIRGSFAGGGFDRQAKVSTALKKGKWKILFGLEHSNRNELRASQRGFSASQDHRQRGGRDLRLSTGYPAVVQAVGGGILNGIVDTQGNPVFSALIPEGASDPIPQLRDFLPGSTEISEGAEGQRRFDTAEYRQLSAPNRRTSGNLALSYALRPGWDLSLSGTFAETRSIRRGSPPVSSPSAETIVPAALNPFQQDVEVAFVHVEFGPTKQSTEGRTQQLAAKINGRLGAKWTWNGGIAHRKSESRQEATDLDREKFGAALRATDPSARFNPFVDGRITPVNAHLYPSLTTVRVREDDTSETRFDLAANGPLLDLPAGPATLGLRGNASRRDQVRISENALENVLPRVEQRRDSSSLSAVSSVPILGGKKPAFLLRRVEFQVSGRISEQGAESGGYNWQTGMVWSPVKPLLFRVRHAESEAKPIRSIVPGAETLVAETLIDPARGGSAASNVEIFNRDFVNATPSTTRRQSIGLTVEPPFVPGLRISVSYDVNRRFNLLEDDFDAQDLINNEAVFPGRVFRDDPNADDLSNGFRGRIRSVDITPGNSGNSERSDLEYSVEYRLRQTQSGRLRLHFMAEQQLDTKYEVSPGIPYIHQDSSDLNPPEWRLRGAATWSRKGMSAALRYRYTGKTQSSGQVTGSLSEGVGSSAQWDLNVGYQFTRPIWRQYGRGVRIVFGIENVLDELPPFADTLNGYRGGSPLGRSYAVSFTVPL